MKEASSNMSSLRGSQVKPMAVSAMRERLKGKTPICSKCGLERLNHYCVEKRCPKKELLCLSCDVNNHLGSHFTHRFCYVLPLVMKAASRNMEDASEYIRDYLINVKLEVEKIQNYAKSFEGMLTKVEEGLATIRKEKIERGLETFEKDIASFIDGEDVDLVKVFRNVDFMTNAECKAKIEAFRKEMITEINKMVWFTDPMKGLRDILTEKQEQNQSQSQLQPHPAPEAFPELTFPSNKIVEVTEIDQLFKQYYELYTHKLQQNHVIVKLDNEYSSKLRMFEALMYNFKKCRSLSIYNININHIRSPIQFSRLRKLEVVCNAECEVYQHLKSEMLSGMDSQITSFSIKKLREEDVKFLKSVRLLFPHLRQLHIELINKYDLANNKQINEFFKGTDPNLQRLSIRFRTEAEVKKLLGNFSKFYKESTENALQENFIKYLHRHPNLTKVHIQGLRIAKLRELFDELRPMPVLFDLKVSLPESPEVQPHTVRQETQKILKSCFVNKRALAVIQSMYMHGHIARVGARLFSEQIIELAVGL